tara:strand:- start:2818 stop:2973 length:156 start_codon:yes stop_codon:yes gene_type:complete
MKNLVDLREQIQEDLICYFNNGALVADWAIDEICQIIVDRVEELQENIENE